MGVKSGLGGDLRSLNEFPGYTYSPFIMFAFRVTMDVQWGRTAVKTEPTPSVTKIRWDYLCMGACPLVFIYSFLIIYSYLTRMYCFQLDL